jgi:small subunit ribosomal protein S2
MKDLPDALFIVDTRKEKIAVAEGKKLGIKIIAMVDTNANPDEVDFPIPANDDAMRSIKLFTSRLASICLEGQEMIRARKEKANQAREAEEKASKEKENAGKKSAVEDKSELVISDNEKS